MVTTPVLGLEAGTQPLAPRKVAKDGAAKDGAAKKFKDKFGRVTLPGDGKRVESDSEGAFKPVQEIVEFVLGSTAEHVLGESNAPETKKAPVAASIMYDHETATPLYEGVAAIISGPFQVTSKHGRKVEGTGMFEFTLASISEGDAVTQPTNPWPVVRARDAKLRFTPLHRGYYDHDGSSA